MPKYIKKPVEIEAMEWTGENSKEISKFMAGLGYYINQDGLHIQTLEGVHFANIGDMIIKGVKGEFYPCKPDIFDLTYDPIPS